MTGECFPIATSDGLICSSCRNTWAPYWDDTLHEDLCGWCGLEVVEPVVSSTEPAHDHDTDAPESAADHSSTKVPPESDVSGNGECNDNNEA